MKSQLRRYTTLGTMQEAKEEEHVYHTGGLVVNDERKEVTVDGEPVKLTRIEYNILLLLIMNKGKVFSSMRFTSGSGKKKPSVRIIPLPYISAISGRRSRLIPRIPGI